MRYFKILFLLYVLLVLPCSAGERVLVVTLGDSLTAGDGDDVEGRGYPARLSEALKKRGIDVKVKNFAISGDTSTDMLNKQLSPALKELGAAGADVKKIALVWIGSNDLFGFYNYTAGEEWCRKMGVPACEKSEMKTLAENMEQALSGLKEAGARCIVALLDDQTRRPVISERKLRAEFFPGIDDSDVGKMSGQIRLYNGRIKDLASKNGAAVVDFYDSKVFYDKKMLSDDGNHPNARGYDRVAALWLDAVLSVLGR